MQKKPTYEELEQRAKESEKEAVRRKRAEEALDWRFRWKLSTQIACCPEEELSWSLKGLYT